MRKLATTAVIGLTLSAICMGAAAAIGGGSFGESLGDFDFFDGKPRCEKIAGATATSRVLNWDGSNHVELTLPGHARYVRGSDDKLRATGDPQVLAHLKVDSGDIELDCRGWRSRTKDLEITLPGREFRKFGVAGTGGMTLDRLDQSRLEIEIAGTGSITATGKVDTVKIEIAGTGSADFGKVASREVEVEMAGVGRSDIAPTERAKIEIAGPGEVVLHSNPRLLETEIAGPGRLRKVPAGE